MNNIFGVLQKPWLEFVMKENDCSANANEIVKYIYNDFKVFTNLEVLKSL